jgi:hypothetical protein
MGKHNWYSCLWTIRQVRNGKVIWEIKDKENILVDSGELAVVDTFFRKNDSLYFASTNFWTGLCKGTVSEETTLVTVSALEPPVLYGYTRLQIERSNVGFPTLDQYEGHWRVTTKEVELTAVGGDIGPINGAFLCTSSDNSGVLIGAVSIDPERTILAGETIYFQLKMRQK